MTVVMVWLGSWSHISLATGNSRARLLQRWILKQWWWSLRIRHALLLGHTMHSGQFRVSSSAWGVLADLFLVPSHLFVLSCPKGPEGSWSSRCEPAMPISVHDT